MIDKKKERPFKGRFAMVPMGLLCSDISDAAFRVFIYLYKHSEKHGYAFTSYDRMCKHVHKSRPTISRAIKELIARGLVSVKRGPRRYGRMANSHYYINWAVVDAMPDPTLKGAPGKEIEPKASAEPGKETELRSVKKLNSGQLRNFTKAGKEIEPYREVEKENKTKESMYVEAAAPPPPNSTHTPSGVFDSNSSNSTEPMKETNSNSKGEPVAVDSSLDGRNGAAKPHHCGVVDVQMQHLPAAPVPVPADGKRVVGAAAWRHIQHIQFRRLCDHCTERFNACLGFLPPAGFEKEMERLFQRVGQNLGKAKNVVSRALHDYSKQDKKDKFVTLKFLPYLLDPVPSHCKAPDTGLPEWKPNVGLLNQKRDIEFSHELRKWNDEMAYRNALDVVRSFDELDLADATEVGSLIGLHGISAAIAYYTENYELSVDDAKRMCLAYVRQYVVNGFTERDSFGELSANGRSELVVEMFEREKKAEKSAEKCAGEAGLDVAALEKEYNDSIRALPPLPGPGLGEWAKPKALPQQSKDKNAAEIDNF